MPFGLSEISQPCTGEPLRRRAISLVLAVQIARDFGRSEQLVDPGGRLKRSHDLESELRHEFHAHLLCQQPAQESLVLLEVSGRLLGLTPAKRENIDGSEVEGWRTAQLRHRERVPAQYVVHDFAAMKNLGERMPDHFAHLELALGGGFAFSALPQSLWTSPRDLTRPSIPLGPSELKHQWNGLLGPA